MKKVRKLKVRREGKNWKFELVPVKEKYWYLKDGTLKLHKFRGYVISNGTA